MSKRTKKRDRPKPVDSEKRPSGQLLQSSAPLVRAQPLVDIIIPIFNHPELVEDCIGTMESTTSVPYRLVLVDDASPDPKVKQYLISKASKATLLHNSQNLGFGATCGKGARSTFSKYICFLNSDCSPMPGWLDVMVEDLESHPDHGIVGPCLLFHPDSPSGPGGRVQHAGCYFDVQKAPRHRFIGWPADHPRVRELRTDLQMVTGACLLTRRSLWNEIGGFAPVYGRGTFEDAEFCIQARFKGKKVVYTPDALLYHHVGASARDGGGFPLQLNYRLFMDRVGGSVQFDEWKVL